MKIYKDESLTNFNFWAGAEDTVKYLTNDELTKIESILEDSHEDGMDETAINDLFWHDSDTIANWLGYGSFEDIMNR